MSFPNFDEPSAWAVPVEPSTGDVLKDAMKKEQLIKDITAAQDDLRAILGRVTGVQGDIDKLTANNATLQTYIDNLTMQMAKRR